MLGGVRKKRLWREMSVVLRAVGEWTSLVGQGYCVGRRVGGWLKEGSIRESRSAPKAFFGLKEGGEYRENIWGWEKNKKGGNANMVSY